MKVLKCYPTCIVEYQRNRYDHPVVVTPPSTLSSDEEDIDIRVIPRDRPPNKNHNGAAITVRNATKWYSSGKPVLSSLNMTVPCGSIYGLLGSSGCGKTTILSCIVGVRKLNSGSILIFGSEPGADKSIGIPGKNIGYMPQEISLYEEFNIGETLAYFGTLAGMGKDQVEHVTGFLIDLLELPPQGSRVINLRIWDYLVQLVTVKRATIIITTHYIEEASQADYVGFMRSGNLLVEAPTQQLMSAHLTSSLESVVLEMCRNDTRPGAIEEQEGSPRNNNFEMASPSICFKTVDDNPTMAQVLRKSKSTWRDACYRVRAMTKKNLTIRFRNLFLRHITWVTAVPMILICLAMGSDPLKLPFGIVNLETNQTMCQNQNNIARPECITDNLSCMYLGYLGKKRVLQLRHYENENEALADVKAGSLRGYMIFQESFTTDLYLRFVAGREVEDDVINASNIYVRLDETNFLITSPVKKALYESFEDFVGNLLDNCNRDRRLGMSSLKFQSPILGNNGTGEADFREYLGPGNALSGIFFFAIITGSFSIIKDRKNGVLARCLVLGVSTWEIMVATAASEFVVLLIEACLNLGAMSYIFEIHIKGWTVIALTILIISGYMGLSIGFVLGLLCSDEIQAALLAMAFHFPNLFISGIFWPTEGIYEPAQAVTKYFPCTQPAESLRSVISRGWGIDHPNVWSGGVVLLAYTFIFFILTIALHTLKN